MNKREAEFLGKLLVAEITNKLPLQSKAFILTKPLEEKGWIQRMVLKQPGVLGILSIKGWALTQAGHIAYCEWCSKHPEPAP